MTPEANTRYWCGIVHEHAGQCQSSVEHALSKIEDGGWNAETLPMIRLRNDATAFRQLADKCDAKLQELLKQQEGTDNG
jgi:hypothetical protein